MADALYVLKKYDSQSQRLKNSSVSSDRSKGFANLTYATSPHEGERFFWHPLSL